ncbi:MAG TPA: hypothetical protein VF245_06780 [Solirubrobacterales bacterium]
MGLPPNADRRRERVFLETDRHRITGEITLPADGYQSRFSDAINRGDLAFLPLTDVEIVPIEGGESARRGFVVVGKAHVRLAHPVEAGA